jgi:hypothetical protein
MGSDTCFHPLFGLAKDVTSKWTTSIKPYPTKVSRGRDRYYLPKTIFWDTLVPYAYVSWCQEQIDEMNLSSFPDHPSSWRVSRPSKGRPPKRLKVCGYYRVFQRDSDKKKFYYSQVIYQIEVFKIFSESLMSHLFYLKISAFSSNGLISIEIDSLKCWLTVLSWSSAPP